MTQDEQNQEDLSRMAQKRARALKYLDEFKVWYCTPENISHNLIAIGLYRDILRGTEEEVDRLIVRLEERNEAALMKKMTEGMSE